VVIEVVVVMVAIDNARTGTKKSTDHHMMPSRTFFSSSPSTTAAFMNTLKST